MKPGLLVMVWCGTLGCALPEQVRYRCEPDWTCAQPGFACGADFFCHPPGDLSPDGGTAEDGGSDAGAADAGLCGDVVCLHFEEGAGASTADATGQNPGTLINLPLWTNGRVGAALSFDGTSTRVDLGNGSSLRISGSLSVCAWIRATGTPGGGDDGAIVSKMGNFERGFQLDTTIDHGPRTIGFKLQDSFGRLMARYGNTAVTENEWHHVTGVYDGPNATLDVYLDGVLDNGPLDGTVATRQADGFGGVTIGSRSGAPGQFNFLGVIDEVMMFDRPLSAAEVAAIYRAAP